MLDLFVIPLHSGEHSGIRSKHGESARRVIDYCLGARSGFNLTLGDAADVFLHIDFVVTSDFNPGPVR